MGPHRPSSANVEPRCVVDPLDASSLTSHAPRKRASNPVQQHNRQCALAAAVRERCPQTRIYCALLLLQEMHLAAGGSETDASACWCLGRGSIAGGDFPAGGRRTTVADVMDRWWRLHLCLIALSSSALPIGSFSPVPKISFHPAADALAHHLRSALVQKKRLRLSLSLRHLFVPSWSTPIASRFSVGAVSELFASSPLD